HNSGHRRHTQQTQKVLTINVQKLIVVQNPWELDDYYSKERIEGVHGKEETISLSLQAFVRSQKRIRYTCRP
ncbi:MAG: hypothetical protein WA220_11285, partial [Candidatus Nitrosopolaris sp.]